MTSRSGGRDVIVTSARLLNVVAAGLLTGNELGSKLTAHPALGDLGPQAHIEAEQALTRRYGQIMPVFMTGTLASFVPVLAVEPDRRSGHAAMTLAGMGCYAAMLAVTLTRNLPINAQLLELDARAASYDDFTRLRVRWERLHTARNVLNVAGLTLTALGAISAGHTERRHAGWMAPAGRSRRRRRRG